MASYQQFTLWTLPDQPLPKSELKDPVFVTVWLFLCLLFAAILRHLLNKPVHPTWQEFRTTMLGTLFLAFWYIITAIDRWLRYDGRAVKYGYIIIAPIWESFRVTSTILLLWGTYTVVWKELEDHFSPRQQGIWWFAAKFALFIVALMSIFYVVLYLALSVVWMEFFSLNVIADIATKRTGFEIAMTAFFMVFGLLTLAEATAALVIGAVKVHGHMEATRLFLWLAALLLFARSTAEFAIITNVYSSSATRQSTKLATDIAYGLITVLYLAMMCCMATVASSTFDRGGKQAKMVASDIRQYVLKRLEDVTNGARKESPAFETIIREVEENLNNVLANGPLTSGLELNQQYKESAARDCIEQLRGEFGKLDPKEGIDYAPRPTSGFSSLFGRRSKSTQMHNASTTTLNSGTNHPSASNSSAATGSSQPSASTGATLVEDPRGFGRAPSVVSSVPGPPRPINLNRPAAPGPQNTGHGNTSRFVPSLGTFPEQSTSSQPQQQQQQQQVQPQQHRYSPPPIQQTHSGAVPNGHSVRDYSATHELLPIVSRPAPPVAPTSTASASSTPSQWHSPQSSATSPEYPASHGDIYRGDAVPPIVQRGVTDSSTGNGSRSAVPNTSTYNPSARWSVSSIPEPPRPIQRPREPQAPTQQQQQSYQSPQPQPEPSRYQSETSRYPPSTASPVPRPIPPPSSAQSTSAWVSSSQSYSSPQSSYAYPASVNPSPTVLPYFSDRNTSARNSPVPRPVPPPSSATRTYTSPTPVAPPSMSPTPMAPRPIPPPSALYSSSTTQSYPAVSGGWSSTPSSSSAQPAGRSRAAEDLPHNDIYEH
ncbi:hypothetical protein B0T19DRAFT_232064 [Cercophora scortea]|uniref:Uncharacterized protein n=1 Tax=Cercophora scortea TaxID=314031 RepID=A0AAE0IG61_9PEZI|nr:hypothetical protein B0T19DRAFT_232064 [Cercophora scortea]